MAAMRVTATVLAVLAGAAAAACSRRGPQEDLATASAAPSVQGTRSPPPTAETEPAPQAGYSAVSVAGVTQTEHGSAVVVVSPERKRALLIFIGSTEALSIQLRLAKRSFRRPLTHDLFEAALDRLGARVESVRVDRVQDNTFYGTVVLREGNRRIELDARSSDAIALALGSGCAIRVANSVIDGAGVDLEQLGELPALDAGTPAESTPGPERDSFEL
jgi:bifunctional DNase/RNase